MITTHGVMLRGGDAARQIVLRPLADEHLPWLYKWNADPEVLYYTEGGTAEEELSYPPRWCARFMAAYRTAPSAFWWNAMARSSANAGCRR